MKGHETKQKNKKDNAFFIIDQPQNQKFNYNVFITSYQSCFFS